MNDETAQSSSALLSFYEYPTFVANPEADLTQIQEKSVTSVKLTNARKPPTWDETVSTFSEHDIYQQRTTELKKYGVAYSNKADADASTAINLGTDKVSIDWVRELPPFPSKYGPMPIELDLDDDKAYILKRVDLPPTYDSVIQWCEENGQDGNETSHQIENDQESFDESDQDLAVNKTCIRIRQDSEDSLGSELSLSPPPRNDDEGDIIDETVIKTPARKPSTKDPLMITGQVTGSSDLQSDKQNTLIGIKEANDYYHLTVLSTEIFVSTRQNLTPDPDFDQVTAIFYAVHQEGPKQNSYGVIALDPYYQEGKRNLLETTASSFAGDVQIISTETELFESFVKKVQELCPDILVGFDTQRTSWGYLCRRAIVLNMNLATELSRMPKNSYDSRFRGQEGASDIDSELHIAGRILLNVWRLLRGELTLSSYTFENVMYHVLKKRLAKFTHQTLTRMWSSNHSRWMVIDYYTKRSIGTLDILEKLDLIGRTAELAKLFGIQFLEVLTRGSQFRVESIMLRLVRAQNYVPVSPTIQQRAKMKAPEYIPLVMEPESRLYNDPVIVLDFQSLYPSIIMAYNYCYSTCLGRIVDHMKNGVPKKPFEFGCTHLKISPERVAKLEGNLNFSPGGIAFLKASVRKGILPKMLQEILDTRVMVKNSMKLHNKRAFHDSEWARKNIKLQKILHSRQLGLKLIANVTYGYTSANFSGRMPCIDVGDSVVSKGRETLERAIRTIEGTDDNGKQTWPGAKVVYGDTDSLFVLLPGRSKDEAFDIGQEMAKKVTQENPKPVKLKFEKVYLPCILQTKKRYVGYMYETKDQIKPTYDAKGIETVRRDGIPATVKMLEKSLRILFETKDVSLVKQYVQNQMRKIANGRISLQELTFAREFRGLHGYRPGACVPALELTRRFCKVDRMRIPNVGERVPYVIVYGEPGKPLIQSVRSPEEVLADKWTDHKSCSVSLRPNASYYIGKVIVPALSRCLSLIGADVSSWYSEMPKLKPVPRLSKEMDLAGASKGQAVIPRYFVTRQCPICLESGGVQNTICSDCQDDPRKVVKVLTTWIGLWDHRLQYLDQHCRSCDVNFDSCRSLDCPKMYSRTEAKYDGLEQIEVAQQLLLDF